MECRYEWNADTAASDLWRHSYNVENRLSKIEKMNGSSCSVMGSASETWEFFYDGDGVRVKEKYFIGSSSTPDSTGLFLFGGLFEVMDDGTNVTEIKYYTIAGMRVAMDDGTLYYLASDHLSSASLVMDTNGTVTSEQRYMPFGEVRLIDDDPTGITETDLTYTGQRNYADFGLMDYRARFYSPVLGRFTQPDTIVPDPSNAQAWNRYSYAYNNPIHYTDPSGHIPEGECGFAAGGCGLNTMRGYHPVWGGGRGAPSGNAERYEPLNTDLDEKDIKNQSLEDLGSPICGEMMGIDPLCAIETVSWTYTDGFDACLSENLEACGYVTVITGMLGLTGGMFYDMAVEAAGLACGDLDCTNEANALAQKLHHIFDFPKHKLDALVEMYDSQEAAYNEVLRVFSSVAPNYSNQVLQQGITIRVNGFEIFITGSSVDGVVKIGSFWIQ